MKAPTEKSQTMRLPFLSRRGGAIGARDLALVTRQMATMIGAGISVDETLQSIAMQSTKPVIREVLTNVRSQVVEGNACLRPCVANRLLSAHFMWR